MLATFCRELVPDEAKRNVWPLTKFSAEAAALIAPYGTVDLTTTYWPSKSKLKVTVHGAKGLPAMDSNGLCDPYAVLHLLPLDIGSHERLKKTKTIYRNRDPVYNKDFDLYVREGPHRQIIIYI
jgi:Ca2+-dependent lipid-binding protein